VNSHSSFFIFFCFFSGFLFEKAEKQRITIYPFFSPCTEQYIYMVHAIGLFGETSLGSRNTLSNGWAVRHTGMIGHISPRTRYPFFPLERLLYN